MNKLIGPDFDIDVYLNPIIPRPRLDLLPRPISWLLGYRTEPPQRIRNVLVWFWAFIGAFAGILVVEAAYMVPALKSEGTPIIIGSLVHFLPYHPINSTNDTKGAAAILHFNTILSPLSQPRNAVISQLLASVLGVSITKLFNLSPHFSSLRFVAGALSVGLTSVAMGITNCVHPPAGATALLAATSPDIEKLGWFLIPLVLLGVVLMLAVACIVNNIQRQFPLYWWTAVPLPVPTSSDDIERQISSPESGTICEDKEDIDFTSQENVVITNEHVVLPDWIQLGGEQMELLKVIQAQLQEGLRRARTIDTNATRVRDSP